MFYNDMISVKCNSSTSLGEVYECINQQTFNISQMIPALAKGASQPEGKNNSAILMDQKMRGNCIKRIDRQAI